jgi:hypothetical protein
MFAERLIGIFISVPLFAAAPTVTFSKSFPGSVPAYEVITVQQDGSASYNESTDKDNAENFKLEPAAVTTIFDYAEKLNHFKGTLESGLKVANMGAKTLRWENGAEASEAKFNYSQDDSVAKLVDLMEALGESEREYLMLKRVIRYDKLGVNDSMLRIHMLYNRKRLYGAAQYLPLLDRVAKDETLVHIARERAAQVAELMRGQTVQK